MGALLYPFGDTLPAPGAVLEVAPGVRWLRMRLPFALDHINLWLLRDRLDGRDGWAIVDCGIADDGTRASWEQVFRDGLDGLPVLRVIVTHMHPDHIGNAEWLTTHWTSAERDCRLWASAADWAAACLASGTTMASSIGGEGAARFYARHGLADPRVLDQVRGHGAQYARLVPKVPLQFRRMQDGMTVQTAGTSWQCIAGFGHAPEHISLWSAELGVLISGDMVLPRISTNVSVFHLEPEADPLHLYLASLRRLRDLPADTLVLPSHGRPFRGLHDRIADLEHHHAQRLEQVRVACADRPHSAAELLQPLFRRQLDLHQTTFAMGEAIAHLHALLNTGELRAETGADGVIRFASA